MYSMFSYKIDIMKVIIRELIKRLLFSYHSFCLKRSYKKLLAINFLPNKKQTGEVCWVDKWSVLGEKVNPIYYRLFSHYIGCDVNILPEDISHDVIESILNPRRYEAYYSDKNVFDRLFPDGYLPQTILRKMNGFYYTVDYIKVDLNMESLYQFLKERKKVMIKPSVDSSSGKGIHLLYKDNGTWFIQDTNEILDVSWLEHYGDNFIIQECIEQHSYISQFNATSVNTLRMTLYRSVKTDEPVILNCIMRIGAKGSIVDNAHAGGCFVGIDVESGKLQHKVFNQWGQSWQRFNDIDFTDDYEIPNWDKIIDFAKSISFYVMHHRLIALDLVLNKEGKPCLIEFNIRYYSCWLFQFTTGTALGMYTDEIIDYCVAHKKDREYLLKI